MLIRIKFEGKSRKLSEKVNTVADLKKKIVELFGNPASQMQIVYKDCDGELVNVMDDDDLKNCYNEAQDLKLNSLTFVVKSKRTGSRSQSSGDDLGGGRQERRRDRDEKSDIRGDPSSKEGEYQNLKKMLFKLDFMSRSCIGEGIEDPISVLRSILNQLEGECTGLASNPKLMAATFANARGELSQALKKGYNEAVSKNPELLKLNEQSLNDWQDFKSNARTRKRGGPGGAIGAGKIRSDSEGMEDQPAREGPGNQDRERYEDRERQFDRERGGYRGGGYQRGRFNGPRRGGDFERDRFRDDRRFGGPRDNRDYGKDEALINERVRRLCYQFPNKSKHELRAIVAQNIEKSPQQLEAMIMQSRKAKSNFY